MSRLTSQETFDLCLKNIREQGGPSMSEDNTSCAYRGVDGRKCAIGFFITDEEYYAKLEGVGAGGFHVQEILRDKFTRGARGLLASLQKCHDRAAVGTYGNVDWREPKQGPYPDPVFMEHFEANMKELARVRQLEYTPPKE